MKREVKVEFGVGMDAVGRRLDDGVGDKGHLANGISLYRVRWQAKDISTPAEDIAERVDIPSEDSIKRATPATAVASDLIDTMFFFIRRTVRGPVLEEAARRVEAVLQHTGHPEAIWSGRVMWESQMSE
jgi:hypothetical protein